jgi:small-conductance mechanosensitive channel
MDNVGICSDVNRAIWQAFDQAGIEIPFPQRVIHKA